MRETHRDWLAGTAILWLLDALFVAAMLVIPLAWIQDPLRVTFGGITLLRAHCTLRAFLFPVIILLVRAAVKRWGLKRGMTPSGPWDRPLFRKIAFSLGVTYAFLTACELTLTWAGFQNVEMAPIVFVGKQGVEGLQRDETLPDPELLYRFKPGGVFAGRTINSLGFRNREVDARKAPGTRRVICMGDSVTAQGRPSYAEYLDARLATNPPTPGKWEAFNVGVHGYSSLQGLKQFRKQVRALEPDVVTVYFGWNGHWLTDKPDHLLLAQAMDPVLGRLVDKLRRKRVFQFLAWAVRPARQRAQEKPGDKVFRVSPEEYRFALTKLVKDIRAAGAWPILITAPRRGMGIELVIRGYALSIDHAREAHDRYVEITREVARDCKADLLDLNALFSGPECDRYFAPDGIHFDLYADEEGMTADAPDRQPGLARIAEELDRSIRNISASEAWRDRQGKRD